MFTIQLKLLVLAALGTLASSTAVLRHSDLGTANKNTLEDIPGHVHTDTNGLGNHNANNAQEGSDRLLGLSRLINIPRNSDDTIMEVGTKGVVYHSHSERPDDNQQFHGLLASTVKTFYSTRQEVEGAPKVHSDLDVTPKNDDADLKKLGSTNQLDDGNVNIS